MGGGGRGQLCLLVPVFSGIVSSFSPFSLMLAIGLWYIVFTMFRYGPWDPIFSNTFRINRCCIFLKAFSASKEIIMFFFPFEFVYIKIMLVSVYWTIPASLGWSLLDHGELSFWCVLGLGLQEFFEYFCTNIHEGNWLFEVLFLCLDVSVAVAS